jgi:parallel beta-helix repeat protein
MNTNQSHATKNGLLLAALLLACTAAQAATITVVCPAETIQAAVDGAQPGDTINVSGTCTENVLIRNEKARITLDGQNLTTLVGGSSANTLTVRGKGILVKRFIVSGGAIGIHVNRGSSAVIDGNEISMAAKQGILVNEMSTAVITNNNIHDNQTHGIEISQSATARIGYSSVNDTAASPNLIQNNVRRGIQVIGGSSAAITGNTISGNGSDGIGIFRLSVASVSSNVVDNNGASSAGNGIHISQNSSIQLGEDNPSGFLDQPNTTMVNNNQYGIRCTLGAVVYGHLGSANQLNGAVSQLGGGTTANTLSGNCPSSLLTP